VGRDSGSPRSEGLDRASGEELGDLVGCATLVGATVNTDEWRG
jgi:hypothetical protein